MSNQLAVLFPGIGYHIDKPLLYYSAKLARARGYDLLAVQYPALPTGLCKDRAGSEIHFRSGN